MEFLKQFLNQEYGLYSFSGRLSRSSFFLGALLLWFFISAITVPVSYLLFAFAPQLSVAAGSGLPVWLGIIFAIYVFILVNSFIIVLAAAVRRLRDAKVSPFWLLLMLIPFWGEAVVFCQLIRRPAQTTEADHE
ncbi:uncharacterized membrane protein YhaH (DUF805 family) [Weissella uvarum]|uniref:DUF805 domain-containing protein n=1 Tax=Weissella uvarum TaxID=1479233 RepID=UPI00196049A6|nr:DUF805 domain-containing protein [Weissella uvarum]MBM7616558.1 uncharacterized membrane protein YhaH (DUF805 family) [Weissella uvarum]MCM0594982.1 DUF805 domain-containing protein [Weissella uvarum]